MFPRRSRMLAFTRLARTAAVAVMVLTVAATPADAGGTIPSITDDQGRTLILHGLNTASSAKDASGLPWITQDDVVRERRDLGSDAVRYLIQWKNVEPRPGVYDEAYLDQVARRLAWYRQE